MIVCSKYVEGLLRSDDFQDPEYEYTIPIPHNTDYVERT